MFNTFHSLINEVGLKAPAGLPNPLITSITCDSRSVKPGSLFIGLQGENVDGGLFWPEALANGAVAVVISKNTADLRQPSTSDCVLVVSIPISELFGRIAASFYGNPSSKISLIGVTGTNGKTTTAHLIEHLSSKMGISTALFGTLFKRWPGRKINAVHTTDFANSLQSQLAAAVSGGVQLAAMEVSSHSLDQNRVSGCRFKGAVFTNLTQDHLDYHSSMVGYFDAKAKLFDVQLLEQGPNRAVVNVDDPWGKILAQKIGDMCWRSSLSSQTLEDGKAELGITRVEIFENRVTGLLWSPKGKGEFSSPLLGRFNLMNLLQAVGVLLQQGFPLEGLLEAISDFPGVPGRMEKVELPELDRSSSPTVLVDYAHTPNGLESALAAVRPFANGEIICVFGCGGDRDRSKRPLMGAIAAKYANRVVVTSDNPRTEDPSKILKDILTGVPRETSVLVELDRATAIAAAIDQAGPKDLILVAGKGHEDYQILGDEKVYFDDKEEVLKALKQRTDS